MLFLVQLAGIDQLLENPNIVRGSADGQQAIGMVPLHVFGTGNTGVRPEGLLDQDTHSVRCEHDVVVAEQKMGGAVDQLENFVGRPAESDPSFEARHEGLRG